MGFFSKCCAKTHLPVLCDNAWGEVAPRLTNIVVLTRGEKPFRAAYDGYGLHLEDFDDAKFVLADAYSGERWEDLPESGYEPGQGFFHDEALIEALAASAGFRSHREYLTLLAEHEADGPRRIACAFSELQLDIPAAQQESMFVMLQEAAHGDAGDIARLQLDSAVAAAALRVGPATLGRQLCAIERRESAACAQALLARHASTSALAPTQGLTTRVDLSEDVSAILYEGRDVPAPHAGPLLVLQARGAEGLGGWGSGESVFVSGPTAIDALADLLKRVRRP